MPNLTFNVTDLVGDDFEPRRTAVRIEANIDPLIDTLGHVIRLGDAKVVVNDDGSGQFTGLLATDPADPNRAGLAYRAWVDYSPRGARERKTWDSGWFTLTADTDLSLVIPITPAPPNTTDDAVIASRLGDSGSLSSAAVRGFVDTTYVREGSAFADASKQAGVDPTGVTECAAALQTFLNSCATLGVRAYAKGTFKVSSTITVKGNADLSDATFNYTGTGTAVQIGVGTSGTLLQYKVIVLPTIVNASKTGTGWTAGTIGVKAVNTQRCDITADRISGFETGYYATALGGGNSYNDVRIAHLDNNKRNLVLGSGAGGWSNQNTYRLGSMSHNSNEGANVTGTRQILIETAGNLVNGNLFLGGSVEGNTAEYHLDCDGPYNVFENIRWENPPNGCRVIWRANATRNMVSYGYATESLVETHVTGSNLNRVMNMGMSRLVGSSSQAVQWLENTSSANNATDVVMDPGAVLAGSDPTAAYRVQRAANFTKMKRATDAFERMQLDHTNGRVYFGNGTAAPTAYVGGSGGFLVAESPTVTTGPVAGSATALPGAPVGYIQVVIGGVTRKIPYWN